MRCNVSPHIEHINFMLGKPCMKFIWPMLGLTFHLIQAGHDMRLVCIPYFTSLILVAQDECDIFKKSSQLDLPTKMCQKG